jgi:hypothetical protein
MKKTLFWLFFAALSYAVSSCSPAYYKTAAAPAPEAEKAQVEISPEQAYTEPPETYNENSRYIVFFAGSQTLSAEVARKIKNSQAFRITLPISQTQPLEQNTSELLFGYHKAEPALTFSPEPYFPLLTSSFKSDNKRYMKSLFDSDIESFAQKTSYKNFGIYLTDGVISESTLDYFELLNANWTVAYNIKVLPARVFKHNKIAVFAPYDNFPLKEAEVTAWIAAKKETIIPVLLKPEHLNNAQFMAYIVNFFDKSEIKPVTPLFITANIELSEAENISFNTVDIPQEFVSKAYITSEIVEKYKHSSNYKKENYDNIKSELYTLYSYELLAGLIKNDFMSKQLYDIAYTNIYKLLGINPPADDDVSSVKFATGEIKQVTTTDNSITITGDGAVKQLTVTSRQNTTDFSVQFATGSDWPMNISYVDVYINIPNTEGAGSTEMIAPTPGVLSEGSGWKYALRIYPAKVTVYKHTSNEMREVASVPILNKYVARISKSILTGSPLKWGVQAVSVNAKTSKPYIIDFFVKQGSGTSKEDLLSKTPFTAEVIRAK